MNIALITPVLSDLGICTISPLLKRENHDISILFIPELLEDCLRPLSGKTTDIVKEFVKDSDIIGINGLSENYYKTASLVDDIRNSTKSPVIWGGIHATLNPQDCLRHADIVCVGEGEEPMLDVVKSYEKGKAVEDSRNLLFRSDADSGKKVELRPPVDLNTLLPLDYDLETQYIVEAKKIRNVAEADFKGLFLSFAGRGCPFRCSYCCSGVMHNMYKGYKVCRQRKVDNAIEELRLIKRRFSSCREIWFNEANFLSGKTQKDIEEFADKYKREIDIPFSIWSHPTAVTDDNIRMLKDCGFVRVNIGTICGNDEIQRSVYNRSVTADLYREKARILKRYNIKVEYDVILCNPYEVADDIIGTIKLLMELPKPFRAIICALTYFPQTELYERVHREGMVKEDHQAQSYTKAASTVWKIRSDNDYLNIVASMMRGYSRTIPVLGISYYGILPEFLLRFLIKKPVIKFFRHIPFRRAIFGAMGTLILIGYKGAKKVSGWAKRLSAKIYKR